MMGTIYERFQAKVFPVTECGCWIWMGAVRRRDGYGVFTMGEGAQTIRGAHRVSWVLTHGAIPDGMHVLHRCDLPCCVNPDHLWLGTHAENMADASRKGRKRWPEHRLKFPRIPNAEARLRRLAHRAARHRDQPEN